MKGESLRIRAEVEWLLGQLDTILQSHDELTDTEVREAIHLTLTHYFVWANPSEPFPINFAMCSRAGDRLVRKVLLEFVRRVNDSPDAAAIPAGPARLVYLQDTNFRTLSGKRFDEFWGRRDTPLPNEKMPEVAFSKGEYEDE